MFQQGLRRLVLVAALLAPAAGHAMLVNEEQQRRDYLAAQDALKAGNLARFRQLTDRLDGYVLHPHLEYELIKDRVGTLTPAGVRAYLERAKGASVGDSIRKRWLYHLAAKKDWENFLKDYQEFEDEYELKCLRLQHLLKTAELQVGLMNEIGDLWLTSKRLPAACDPVFAAWKTAGHMTSEKVWDRIQLAMERRRPGHAQELAHYLEPKDRVWVTRWVEMHHDPAGNLARLPYRVDTPPARRVVRHGVVQMAYRDPDEAMRQWERLKQKYYFFGEDDNYVWRHVGILAAQMHLPSSVKWLAQVSADPADENLHLWRVRAALRFGEWETAKRFVSALTEEQQKQPQWRYWKARVLEKTGELAEADKLYRTLARERNYYGFLAADHLGLDYSMQHQPAEASPEDVTAMLARNGIRVAQEFYEMGLINDARRQWHWLVRQMNNRELIVAAVIARQWGWHDRAVLTVSKSDFHDDLDLRFPLLYRDTIEASAARAGIDPGWVYGVVRQESAFVPDAKSSAGALGLMQLMPMTGRLTGRRLNIPVANNQVLLDIQKNVTLGTGYLKEMLDRNRGNQVMATASYNAGPNRVTDWVDRDETVDAEIWVETIPFNETRDYVKNVLAFTAVYDYRLGMRPTRLKNRMPAVSLQK